MSEKRIQDFATAADALDDDLLLIASKDKTYNIKVKTLKDAVQGDADRAEAAAQEAKNTAQQVAKSVGNIEQRAASAESKAATAVTAANQAVQDAAAAQRSASNTESMVSTAQTAASEASTAAVKAGDSASAAASSASSAQEAATNAASSSKAAVEAANAATTTATEAKTTAGEAKTAAEQATSDAADAAANIKTATEAASKSAASAKTAELQATAAANTLAQFQEIIENGVVQDVQSVDDGLKITYTNGGTITLPIKASGGLAFSSMVYDTETHYLHLYDENEKDVIDPVYIPGGGGGGSGGSSGVTLTNETYVNGEKALSFAIAQGQTTELSYTFTDTDPDFGGAAAYYVNGVQVATANIVQSVKITFNPTEWLVAGDNKIRVVVTDENGATGSKTWTVSVLTVSVSATLSESTLYTVGTAFRISYTPVGSGMSKTTHFLVDGKQVAEATTTYSGRQLVQNLTISKHGAHDIDIYTTTTASGSTITSPTVHFCIAVVDAASNVPIITVKDKKPSGRVYMTAAIQYMVYDPSTEQASVKQSVDGVETALTVGRSLQSWAYKPRTEGEHALKLTCGETSVTMTYTATALGYDIHPANVDAKFDFDPSGRSNSAADRDTWVSNGVSLTVDKGFDWTNGGYQQDTDGNTAFVIRAGHTATINYNLFGSTNLQAYGASFKMIYTAKNVRKFDAVVAQCLSDGIGLDANAKEVTLSTEQTGISQFVCEGERTELVYNITSRSKNSELFLNLQGIPSRFATYSESDRLAQRNPVPLTIGSPDCDVWLYRCKFYDISLGDADMMDNFIADAPDPDEMIARYERNSVDDGAGNIITDWNASSIDEAYIDNLAKSRPGLRVIKLRVPRFTTDKNDKVSGSSVEHLLYGARAKDCWKNESVVHRGQGTSSNAYGKAGRNMDFDCKGKFVYTENGVVTEADTYDMTENSVGETYFNLKLNIASSENMNNAMLAELFNKYQPYIRAARSANPKVRDTMEFHPCVVFVYNESAEEGFTQGQWIFYGVGDFGNSKKDKKAQGLDSATRPNECIVELCNNTHVYNRFKGYEGAADASSWESDDNPNAPLSFRYIADTCDEAVARNAWSDVVKWVYSTDRTAATGEALGSPVTYGSTTYTNDTAEYRAAKFVNEFDQHFESKSTLYHYLFTSFFTMPDNRAKNTFPHCEDVTAAHPIWDYCFGYDFDTAMGNNNEGDLALDYGMEDTDQLNGGNVFNAQDSVLWVNVRDLLNDRLNAMVATLTELFDADRLNVAFDAYQSLRPERLLVADARRKYIRPYEDLKEGGTAITMFIPMMNGDKRLQRHYFLKYNSIYFASKWNTAVARNDKITLRGFASPTGEIAAITITPYSDLYASILFGSILKQQRCKRGEPVTLSMSKDTALNDTEIYIYSASMLEAVEGIASVYTNQADFSAATKLRSIVIGSDDSSYSNVNLTSTIKLDFSALAVLEELRIDHCPNLNAPVDVSGCVALKVASFKGTPVSAVNFAAGSALEECYLESPVSLTLRNMQNIKKFDVADNYANLTGLRHENTPFPAAYDIVNAASELYTVRLAGIDWQLTGTEILNRLLSMGGYDENGIEIGRSALSGKVYTSVIRQAEVESYAAAWPDLAVTYGGTVQQYKVTFCNYDGTALTLKDGSPAEFLVDRGADCADPIRAGLMDTPTKASTQAEVFTYGGWDSPLTQVLSNLTVKATYTSVPQKYTVRWYAQAGVVVGSKTVDYDTEAVPTADPERTDEESSFVYHLFDGWDKSTAHVKENMDVYARWIRGTLPNFGDDLSNLNLAQLYGIRQSGRASLYFTEDNIKTRVPFTMGYEPQFDNVESVLLAENMELTGSTSKNTGVKIMDKDTGWTLVVDCVFDQPTSEACVAACFTKTGYHGFKVKYSNGTAVQWSTNTANNSRGTGLSTISGIGTQYIADQYRELVVLRHVKGSRNLFVYFANPNGDDIISRELTKTIDTASDATLMLGCDNDGKNFATGFLYRCKLWKDDLGETECLKMAAWPREESYLEVVGTGGATKTGGGTTSIDLIHAGLLNGYHRMNPTNSNDGGWPASEMRSWLQKRYLAGLPSALRRMLVSVHISSVDYGAGTAGILETEDKVYLPSLREMNGENSEPFVYCGERIPWFTSDRTRIKFAGYTLAENPTYTVSSTAPKNPKKGDVWICSADSNVGYLWNGHAWVRARWYWLRDASVSYSTVFSNVSYTGWAGYNGNAAYSYGVLPRLHL